MTAAVLDDRLFADAVMARVAREPLPTPVRALRAAISTLDGGLAAGAIWTAWHLTVSRNLVLRTGVRMRSAALLAALLLMLAIGTTLAAAGAAVVVKTLTDAHAPTQTTNVGGGPGPAQDGGIRAQRASAPPTDTPGFQPVGGAANPSPSPDADNPGDDNSGDGDNPGPESSPSPGDGDHGGGGSGDNGSGDNSGGGGDGGDDQASPQPSDSPDATNVPDATNAPDATDAPQASNTPEPSDGLDDGGPDDSGGGTGG